MGLITGINHILLVCQDMNRTVDFYVNVLGLTVKGTSQGTLTSAGLEGAKASSEMPRVTRTYHLITEDGTDIAFSELPDMDTQADGSLFVPSFWPGAFRRPLRPSKVDHIALSVRSRADLLTIQGRLRDRGIEVSDLIERPPSADSPMFVKSIYFYDPDGIPLEVASWDRGDPAWALHDDAAYFRDPDPVPSMPPR